MLQKIGYKKEPTLAIHKYVVAVGFTCAGAWKTKFHYCTSKREVRAVAEKAKKGAVIEVFSATHNFIQGYQKV